MKSNVLLIVGILLLPILLNCNPTGSDNNSVPGIPDIPVLSSPSNGATTISLTPTLTWSTASRATTYRVQVSTTTTFASRVADDSLLSVANKTISTALNSSTKYYWRVNAKNTGGTGSWSATWGFTTGTTAPGVPTLTSPGNGATTTSLTPALTWNTVSGATTYRVQLSTISTFVNPVLNDSTVSGGTKTVSAALSVNTTYYWRVNAKNAGGTGSWSAIRSFTTQPPVSSTVTDADGNVYHIVTIGTQTWTVENLKTTKYNDGAAIPLVTSTSAWSNLTTSGYCWYNNDAAANKNTYGALYNWYTVNTGKLAPTGWHVPSDAEWDTLQNYLVAHGYNWDGTTTGNKIAKSMAAQTIWSTSTITGTIGNNLSTNNRSGFSALPSGCRSGDGTFGSIAGSSYWWSATEVDASLGYYRNVGCNNDDLYTDNDIKSCGFSVRLVKD
jgi:uncharacterized protein (TIGR02145 family)